MVPFWANKKEHSRKRKLHRNEEVTNMDTDRISQTQLCALLWAGLLAPVAELLPGVGLEQGGRGAWLVPLLLFPALAAVGALLAKLGQRPGGLAAGILQALGPVEGRAVLLAYLLWGEVLLTLRLRLCAQRLITSGERDGSLWFFLPVVAALALWMARGKTAAFARAAQIFLGVLLTAAGVVLGLALLRVRRENLLPLWWEDALPILRAVPGQAGVLGWGIYAAFLLGETKPAPRARRDWLIWCGAGCALLALEQVVIVGNFGAALCQRLNTPFFALAKSVGVEGAFQRVESIIAALWILADLALLTAILLALWRLAAALRPKTGQKSAVTAALLPAVVMAFAAFPDGVAAERTGRGAVLWGNLIFALGLPLLSAGVVWIKGKRNV